MMKALRSSETSVLTKATPRNIPEDGILRSHLRKELNSYVVLIVFYPFHYSFFYYYLSANLQST
jgi:hypothetical protein